MNGPNTAEAATRLEPAVEIRGLSKTYRAGKGLLPVPVPALKPGGGQSRRIRDAGVDRIDDDEELDETVDEEDDDLPERSGGVVHALTDIDLDLEPGTSLGLIGRNGSGKSTLLKILARIAPPTAGRVTLNGRVAPMLGLSKVVMNVESTGRENVHLVARFYDVPREVVSRRMAEIMRFAGLEGYEDQLGKTYSSGMWRRLAFSTVLNLEPDILLADEELAVGDVAFREHCISAIEASIAEGLTLVFASHDMELVRHLCAEAVWLEDGRIKTRGSADEVTAAYDAEHGPSTPGRPAAETAGATAQPGGKPPPATDERVSIGTTLISSSDGTAAPSIRSTEPILIEVGLDVARAGIEIQCVVALTAKGVARLLARQPEPFRIAERGRYTVSAFVPGDSFPDGVYRGKVAVRIFEDGERAVIDRRDAFSIDVERIEADEPGAGGETEQLDDVQASMVWDVQGPHRVG